MYQALLPQTEREQFDSLQNIPKFGLFLQSANGYKFICFLFLQPFPNNKLRASIGHLKSEPNSPLNWLLLAFVSFEKKKPFNVHTQGPFLFLTCSFLTKNLSSSIFIQYSRVFYSASQINVHIRVARIEFTLAYEVLTSAFGWGLTPRWDKNKKLWKKLS